MMNKNMKHMSTVAAMGVAAAMLAPSVALAEQDRISASEKGSLLIYSAVSVFTNEDNVIEDTFLTLTNDFNEDVKVQLYMVNGETWDNVDTEITLTANQPIFWSARTGQPAGGGVGSGNVSPFPSINPSSNVHLGYILAWAVDEDNEPIRWNHLSGSAMVVSYAGGVAFEYSAWASQVSDAVPHGERVNLGESGTINLNGTEYAPTYDQLLMNFYAPGAILFSTKDGADVGVFVPDSGLILHLVDADLRQDGTPRRTKADADIWNMNETKFSNTRRCITCWDAAALSSFTSDAIIGIDPPNNFLLANLQTRAGKARIQGNASTDCDGFHQGIFLISESLPLLGIRFQVLFPSTGVGGLDVAATGTNLFGMGTQEATIQYDALSGSPPERATNEARRPAAADDNAPRRGLFGTQN